MLRMLTRVRLRVKLPCYELLGHAMIRTCKLLTLITLLAVMVARPVRAQTGPEPVITSPQVGNVLQGTVSIIGSDNKAGFLSSEVAFAYSGDTTGTWFLIKANDQPVVDGVLSIWDTTTITDGVYNLRLRVFLDDGTFQDVIVVQMRVRNYTPVETPTPTVTPLALTLVPTITRTPTPVPTSTPIPTPTALLPNPAILTSADISISIGYGGVAALIFLSVIGLYLWLRRK